LTTETTAASRVSQSQEASVHSVSSVVNTVEPA